MDITWLGHSALLVEAGRSRILIDPGAYSDDWHGLTGLTHVLVTHVHPDHVDVVNVPALLDANPDASVRADAAAAEALTKAGCDAEVLETGTEADLGGVSLRAVGGHHACIHEDFGLNSNVGLLLRADGTTLYHPGDDISTVPDGVDVLALPISAPWSALKDTAQFLRAVRPARWFPIHDAILSATGRGLYVGRAGDLAPEGSELLTVERGTATTL